MEKVKFTEYIHTITKELGYIAQYNGQVVAVIEGRKKISRTLKKAEYFMEKKGYIKREGGGDGKAY